MTILKPTDDHDPKLHMEAIEGLSQQFKLPRELVTTIYGKELQRMNKTVRIRNYLHILIGKNVRDKLQSLQETPTASSQDRSCGGSEPDGTWETLAAQEGTSTQAGISKNVQRPSISIIPLS